MNRTLHAFADELQKIATVQSKKLNRAFGLPLKPSNKPPPRDVGPSAAHSADRHQSPISDQATPNINMSNTMSPQFGPGGV